MRKRTVWVKGVGDGLQFSLLHETLGSLQQTRQETVSVFEVMAVEVSSQSPVQDLVANPTANRPSITVRHH